MSLFQISKYYVSRKEKFVISLCQRGNPRNLVPHNGQGIVCFNINVDVVPFSFGLLFATVACLFLNRLMIIF